MFPIDASRKALILVAPQSTIRIKQLLDMIYKAQSPAGFAEEYIVESIWNNRFPPGSILPAERELSELIGVTRTTLREVLQRLARDGWLTIQHGKPTRVNNFWETSGLNILETIARLDQDGMPKLIDQLLAARTNISVIYIRGAVKHSPEAVISFFERLQALEPTAEAFTEFDYAMHHTLAFSGDNPIYVLILNGFRGLYEKVGRYYFSNSEARDLARRFYGDLRALAEKGDFEKVPYLVRGYGQESGRIWSQIRARMPQDIADS